MGVVEKYMNHPHDIVLKRVTPGFTDQDTGEWNAPTSTTTLIEGGFQPDPLVEHDQEDVGFVDEGMASLVSESTGILRGDLVEVYHDHGSTTYVIRGIVDRHEGISRTPLGRQRIEYMMERQDEAD